MYITSTVSTPSRREQYRQGVLEELHKMGVKLKPKKFKRRNVKGADRVFKVPLAALPATSVSTPECQKLTVPKIIHDLCMFMLKKKDVEGIFRREGSKLKVNDMKRHLGEGGSLTGYEPVIEVAALFKIFLRELPEPIIPYAYHDIFLKAFTLSNNDRVNALLMACLLIPDAHLDALCYVLQFLYQFALRASTTKMNSYNLSVVMGPNIFPVDLSYNANERTIQTVAIIQILVEHHRAVGNLPTDVVARVEHMRRNEKSSRKRRSGSLTRMFNGLKKIVGSKTEDHSIVTPDLLITPITHRSRNKTVQSGFSVKKKNEVLSKLTDNVLTTPFIPRTPISMDQSGPQKMEDSSNDIRVKSRKSQWFLRSKSMKNLKPEEEDLKTKLKNTTRAAIERRWSAIGQVGYLKNAKKRNSAVDLPRQKTEVPDYIRVSKTEYEAIKNRVSAMERRISIELETVQSHITTENDNNENENITNVQTVYEQTLEQAPQMSSSTDHLARRLSRELKIRPRNENKVIRSPSARKIGSIRRRSRELERNGAKITRHQSLHNPQSSTLSLKRPEDNKSGSSYTCNLSGSSCDTWTSAEGFFETLKSHTSNDSLTNRASLAELRNQNAGMVLAKAKLFDQNAENKVGAVRNYDSRVSYRVRTLRCEDRKVKKNVSPRRQNQRHKLQIARRCLDSSLDNADKEVRFDLDKSMYSSPLKDCNRGSPSPKFNTPRIKRSLHVKSPKRLCRTPVRIERGTPLKVMKSTVY